MAINEKEEVRMECTGGPPYPQIQYLQFQISAVYCCPKKNWKIKEMNGS